MIRCISIHHQEQKFHLLLTVEPIHQKHTFWNTRKEGRGKKKRNTISIQICCTCSLKLRQKRKFPVCYSFGSQQISFVSTVFKAVLQTSTFWNFWVNWLKNWKTQQHKKTPRNSNNFLETEANTVTFSKPSNC